MAIVNSAAAVVVSNDIRLGQVTRAGVRHGLGLVHYLMMKTKHQGISNMTFLVLRFVDPYHHLEMTVDLLLWMMFGGCQLQL